MTKNDLGLESCENHFFLYILFNFIPLFICMMVGYIYQYSSEKLILDGKKLRWTGHGQNSKTNA